MKSNVYPALVALLAMSVCSASAQAGSHLWRIHEIFSNADGTIQFVEMKECCGGNNEFLLMNLDVTSAVTGHSFIFPENLPCTDCTANKHLLLATQSFADLHGAPTPDYIIAEDIVPLFSTQADTLTYYSYPQAVWTFAAVPTDGINSLNHSEDGDTIAINSPTNFNDETGSVVVPCNPADFDLDGAVTVDDLLSLLAAWGPCSDCQQDIDNDGAVGVTDLLQLIAHWGSC